tara:strand:+ start:1672 stop:3363 length:1692 start_codon:yes stop_codon:yes gene_type:complete
MATARDFHVKTGLVVDGGNVTLSNGNLLVNSGHVDIDSIKIDGQTISTVTGNEDINITPHGTGSVVFAKVDINGGAIDGTVIGGASVAAGSFAAIVGTSLDINGAADISGDLTLSAGGDGALTFANAGENSIKIPDSQASALIIEEANNAYLTFDTSNEKLVASKQLEFGSDGSGVDVTFYSATAGDKMVWDASEEQLVITGTNGATALNVADGNVTVSDTLTATNIGAFQASGAIDFNNQAMTNVDINSGSINVTDITAATIDATTDFTVGSTVITDDSIVMTPSSGDTLSITSTTNGESTIATVDGSGSLAAHLNIDADGAINLKFNSNTKLATATDGIDVTGNASLTGSIDSVTNVTASGFIHSGHARMRESTGVLDATDVTNEQSGTHKIIDIDGTNFYTSETISVTEVSGRVKLPSASGAAAAYGTNANNIGGVIILALAVGDTGTASNSSTIDIFQAAEAFCVATIKNASNVIQKRVVNKVYGLVNASGNIETIVEHESGDVELGRFVWMKHTDGAGSTEDTMVLVFQYTSKYTHTSNDISTYSVNVNGLSIGGAGG